MPRIVLVLPLLALGLFTTHPGSSLPSARAQEATPAVGCAETSAAEREATARRWFDEVLNGGDLAVLDELLSPDFRYHSGTRPVMNAEELANTVLGPILTGFPDVAYAVEDVISDEDDVVLIWRAQGTQTGEFQGYAPSGNGAEWTGINVYRFQCGRVSEVWAEFDALGRLRQLGLLATPTP